MLTTDSPSAEVLQVRVRYCILDGCYLESPKSDYGLAGAPVVVLVV